MGGNLSTTARYREMAPNLKTDKKVGAKHIAQWKRELDKKPSREKRGSQEQFNKIII